MAQNQKSVGVDTKAGDSRQPVTAAAAARRSSATAAVVDSATEPLSRPRKASANKRVDRTDTAADGKVVAVSSRKKPAKAVKPAVKATAKPTAKPEPPSR